jgi:hypothetical protein
MSSSFKKLFGTPPPDKQLPELQRSLWKMDQRLEDVSLLAAQSLVRQNRQIDRAVPLRQTEFRVFSQFGDDGIIQYILHRLNLPKEERRFVEFGVESYKEANTRFLLLNDNWGGLIMDGSEANMTSVRSEDIYWKHDLTALARFITPDNINDLLRENGFTGRIGLLSIDIDGNDYWVWEKITAADPALVIVEYNGLFGGKEAVTVPLESEFTRGKAHYSNLYWGTSLPALCQLAERKGYRWIGCNSSGNNAYFVRKADADLFAAVRLPDDYVAAKFREGRGEDGRLNFLGQRAGRDLLKDFPVYDVTTNQTRLLGDLEF